MEGVVFFFHRSGEIPVSRRILFIQINLRFYYCFSWGKKYIRNYDLYLFIKKKTTQKQINCLGSRARLVESSTNKLVFPSFYNLSINHGFPLLVRRLVRISQPVSVTSSVCSN